MIKNVMVLIAVLLILPGAVIAAEIISNDEMAAITGEAGIIIDDLSDISLEELHEILTYEKIQELTEGERQELRQIIKEKFDALSETERVQLRAQMRQRMREKMANMTPEELGLMMKQIRQQREERLAAMTPEEREQMHQLMQMGNGCIPLEDRAQLQQRLQEQRTDMTPEELDQMVKKMSQRMRRLGCCPSGR